jgi:hypothetical protein
MWKMLCSMLAAGLLAGCAGISSVSSEVSSFGDWPPGRAPGSYAFDRLPSQQALAAETERLEAAARPALHKAGFQPVAEGQAPDVLVQVGARTRYTDYQPWGDPLWWRGGFGYTYGRGYGRWYGPMWYGPAWGWSAYYYPPRYDREVALLLRDRASGKPLFEARASNDGFSQADDTILAAMFEAALFDFPRLGINPRQVVIPLAPAPR